MQTIRCEHCGEVLGTYVNIVPGLGLPFATDAALAQVEERSRAHREQCPGQHLPAAD